MTTRKEILTAIRSDFESKLNIDNGYNTDLNKVIPGLPTEADLSQYPSIGYMLENDRILEEYMDDKQYIRRELFLIIYGFSNTFDSMINLCEDVEILCYTDDFINSISGLDISLDKDGASFYYQKEENNQPSRFEFYFKLRIEYYQSI